MIKGKDINQEERFDESWRQSIGGLKIEPSARLWSRLNRKIFWREIFRFNFSNVPGYAWMTVSAVAVITAAVICWVRFDDRKEDAAPPPAAQQFTAPAPTEASSPAVTSTAPPAVASVTESDARTAPAAATSVPVVPAAPSPSTLSAVTPRPDGLDLASSRHGFLPLISLLEPEAATLFPGRTGSYSSMERIANPKPALIFHPEPLTGTGRLPRWLNIGINLTPDIVFYRNISSYFKYDYTLDAGIQYNIGRFYIQSGAGVAWSSDIGTYAISANKNDSIGFYYDVISFSETPGNPGQYQYNTQLKTVYDTVPYVYDYSTVNTYTYVEIPLTVGYRLVEKPRWSMAVDAGGFWSGLIARNEPEPDFYIPEARVTDVENNTPDRRKNSFGLMGNIRFEYRFAKRFSLVLAPSFKYHLNAIKDDEIPDAVQPWSVGLRTGIWYRIGLNR